VPPGAHPPPLLSTPRAAVRCQQLEARDYLGQSDQTSRGSWPRVCNSSTCPSPTPLLVFFSIRQVSSCFLSRSPSILSWYCAVFFCCYCVVRLCAAGSAAPKPACWWITNIYSMVYQRTVRVGCVHLFDAEAGWYPFKKKEDSKSKREELVRDKNRVWTKESGGAADLLSRWPLQPCFFELFDIQSFFRFQSCRHSIWSISSLVCRVQRKVWCWQQ
jgi:hypothetical protein